MSIEFASYFTAPSRITEPAARPASERRREANRRNARKSTGPRTAAGKKRSAQNSLKHGLCADTAIPPCEDALTFNLFLDELRAELQPVTAMQNILFPQIANLMWRLRRLPEAQAHLFSEELQKSVREDESPRTLTASEVLARRFSDDPHNGFALLGRYERTCQNMLLRLMRQYEQLKKRHPYGPSDPSFDRVPREGPEPAVTDEKMRLQAEAYDRREEELKLHIPPRDEREAGIDQCIWLCAEQQAAKRAKAAASQSALTATDPTKRTQTNPPQNPPGDSESSNCPDSDPAPVTERTQRDAGGNM